MPAKLPFKFPSTRVKSPASRTHPRPRPRPRRHSYSPPPSSSKRSRSHDPSRRPSEPSSSSSARYPPSARRSSYTRPRSPERQRRPSSPDRSNGRQRRRRDSSSSPERYERSSRRVDRDHLRDERGRQRPLSYAAAERGPRRYSRDRPSSARYPTPPRLRPGPAPGAFYREGEHDPRRYQRRSSTPDRYKPSRHGERRSGSSGRRPSRHEKDDSPASAKDKQEDARPQASPAPPPSASNFLGHMPSAFAAYAGLKTVTKHADTAKEWVSWLNEMNETPEEIQSISAKATTARDTITQVQQTLKARPDLLEGKNGEQLKEQIEEAIECTDKALGKMTKLISDLSKKGADHGDVVNGMQDFWRSYRYKNEFEDQVKMADEELQMEMTRLSTLMVNIYSRSLMKPAPPRSTAAAAPPGPMPESETRETKETRHDKPETQEERGRRKEEESGTHPPSTESAPDSSRPPVPKIVEPEPGDKGQPDGPAMSNEEAKDQENKADSDTSSPPPRPPSAVADEEAAVGSPPPSSSHGGAKEPGDLPTPPHPSTDEKLGSKKQSPSREARGSISEQEAQDALLDAAWDGDLDGAAQALRHTSHSCCDMRGLTPLHLAAERDHIAVAILLLDRGADIHARSDGRRNPLHLASRSASSSMVEMLLERAGADPNAQTAKGRTPLHYAASKAEDGDEERREVLRVLRDWGADPTLEDREGETARDVAQKREHWDASSTLRRAERKWEEDHKQNWLQKHGFIK